MFTSRIGPPWTDGSALVLPYFERLEHSHFLLFARLGTFETSAKVGAADDHHAVGVADDPVAALDRHAPAANRRVDRAGLGPSTRHASAIMEENTGKPCASIALMSRTPPSITRPASPRASRRRGEHLAPVAELAHLADVDDERVAGRGRRRPRGSRGCRLACTGPGTPAPRAGRPATPARIRARMARAPLSPSVAAPSSSSAWVISTSRAFRVPLPGPVGGGRGI